MAQEYNVHIGGLFRCCLASIDEAMLEATIPPKEGDTHTCKYCKKETMVFENNCWRWKQK
jgi:hypothetical protein